MIKLMQAARERLAKATPGPWYYNQGEHESLALMNDTSYVQDGSFISTYDQDFITHAPTDLTTALKIIDVLVDAIHRYIKEDASDSFGSPLSDAFLTSAELNLRDALDKSRELSGEKEEV